MKPIRCNLVFAKDNQQNRISRILNARSQMGNKKNYTQQKKRKTPSRDQRNRIDFSRSRSKSSKPATRNVHSQNPEISRPLLRVTSLANARVPLERQTEATDTDQPQTCAAGTRRYYCDQYELKQPTVLFWFTCPS